MKTGIMIFVLIAVISSWTYGYVYQADWLGNLDTLFSGLAFFGVIVTIFLQQKELHQNTQALLAQKTEMTNQWIEMDKQNTNMKRQRFETSLFSMWNLHFETRNQIRVRDITGILAFKEFVNLILMGAQEAMKSKYPTALVNEMPTSCLFGAVPRVNMHTDLFTVVEPYINSLKLIYNSIKQAELKDEAETRYIELMQSYLTNYEVIFIVLYYIVVDSSLV